MKEKFPGADGVNEEDVEKMLDYMTKEIEKDLNSDPEALREIEEREAKKKAEADALYEEDEEFPEIDLGEIAA